MTLARRKWHRLSRFLDPPSHTLTVHPWRSPQLAESIKRRLAGRGESAVGGLRFAELWRRLSQRKGISNKWGVLQLLSTLHDTATTRGANPKVRFFVSVRRYRCTLAEICRGPHLDRGYPMHREPLITLSKCHHDQTAGVSLWNPQPAET